jgi:aminodeoxyfutalosine synthase
MQIIDRVQKKLAEGTRLTPQDALELYAENDVLEIGRLASEVNRRKNQGIVYYNVNRHINPTNICVLSCKFCAYSRKPGEEGGYAYSIPEMVEKATEAVKQGATEVHMVGGLHPRWNLNTYLDMIRAIREAHPSLHIKAFTVVELDWMARKARLPISEVLERLVEAGLNSLPGGGAEIFHPEIRDRICDTKVSAEDWLGTHKLAHQRGLKSNATMLYGHIEKPFHRVDHMLRLRTLQDETKGFNAFIPLAFQPFQNEMGIERYTLGLDDVRTIAIARLFLDNFQHIKTYWIMLGQDVAQLGLEFGANDIDGTVTEEKISRMAGGRAGMVMSRQDIETIIRRAGYAPQERNTVYEPIGLPPPDAEQVTQKAFAKRADDAMRYLHRAWYEHAELSTEEFIAVAKGAPLHLLGTIAHRKQIENDPTAKPCTRAHYVTELAVQDGLSVDAIVFDLAAIGQNIDLRELEKALWAYHQLYPGVDIVLAGIKAVWQLAQAEHLTVSQLFRRLSEHGLTLLESSPAESEHDLTPSEIVSLHAAAHKRGLGTIGRVELLADEFPMWEHYWSRLQAFEVFAHEPLFKGLQIAGHRSTTIVDYCRAVALARLLTSHHRILTPPIMIPHLSPDRGLGTKAGQLAVDKVVGLVVKFGSSGFGHCDLVTAQLVDCLELPPAVGAMFGLGASAAEASPL